MVRHRSHAFTLLELLIVMGLIAVLIGILIPVLSKGRNAAIQIHCLSQVRQMVQSLEMHGNDTRDLYPIAGARIDWGQIDPATHMPSWMEQLFPYIPSMDVMSGCGNYPRATPYHYFLATRAEWVYQEERPGPGGPGFAPVQRNYVQRPASFILTGDNNCNFSEEPDADKDDYTQPTLTFKADYSEPTAIPGGSTITHWEPQHLGALNIAFADGHAASFKDYDPDRMTWRYDTMSLW